MSDVFLPLNGPQIIARLERLEQNQIAAAASVAPAITGPLGIRLMSASSPAQVLAAIPDTPRRQPHPFSY